MRWKKLQKHRPDFPGTRAFGGNETDAEQKHEGARSSAIEVSQLNRILFLDLVAFLKAEDRKKCSEEAHRNQWLMTTKCGG